MTSSLFPIAPADITGLVLAGGRGSRMGGVDKGLQPFRGQPLAQRALLRLAPQVGPLRLNANRHAEVYAAWGVPVCPDPLADYPGPLAGLLAGLRDCPTPWLLSVPCDSPLFPADLAARMAAVAQAEDAEIVLASAPEAENTDSAPGAPVLRPQPVFCLLRSSLADSLAAYLDGGGRKIATWTARHRCALAAFDQAGDDPRAFANANTLAELQALE